MMKNKLPKFSKPVLSVCFHPLNLAFLGRCVFGSDDPLFVSVSDESVLMGKLKVLGYIPEAGEGICLARGLGLWPNIKHF